MKIDLTRIRTRQQLLKILAIDETVFQQITSFDPTARRMSENGHSTTVLIDVPIFVRHVIPKRNRKRGFRIVWEPICCLSSYKALARWFGNFFSHVLPDYPHPRAFGYLGGRNIRDNAWDHRGNKFLISVDVKEFFPTISMERITQLLRTTGINDEVAGLIAKFVTIGGRLPLGLPTSPTIANAICLRMDRKLQTLAQETGSTFSRYADDISFSSNHDLPTIEQISAILNGEGFELAKEKTRRSKIGQAHFVTGLSISDCSQPHVPQKKKRKLRQELHYASKFGLDDHFRHQGINDPQVVQAEINRLDGLVKYVAYHEPKQAGHLKTTWLEILQTSGNRASFAPKNQHRTPFIFHVDEAEYAIGKERLLAIGMSVSQHQAKVYETTDEILNAELSDIWAAGKRDAVERRGIHFSDATQDLRLKYVKQIAAMPFEGYIAFARLPNSESYETIYLRLLGSLIVRRLMAAESRLAMFYFEVNNKVSKTKIESLVSSAYDELRRTKNRHPESLGLEFVQKPHLGMSVPDFLLGILGLYLKSGPDDVEPIPRDKLLFERIRDKYRLILDVDNSVEYTRRRPVIPF